MPIIKIKNFDLVTIDFSYDKIHWKKLSNYIKEKIGTEEINDSNTVEQILKESFQYLITIFDTLILCQRDLAFFIMVHHFHENSVDLWLQKINGTNIDSKVDLGAVRRIYKIILEQSCALDLNGAYSFDQDIYKNQLKYIKDLEELLYIGYHLLQLSDFIAKSQLFPQSINIKIEYDELTILTNKPYTSVYNFIDKDISSHDADVVVTNTVKEFVNIWKYKIGIDYGKLASIIKEESKYITLRYVFVKCDILVKGMIQEFNYLEENVKRFYDGFTISKDNYLSTRECLLTNQHQNRYMYRPIIKYTIKGINYYLFGREKWNESIVALTSNAFPFGQFPKEWAVYKSITDFVKEISAVHDFVLEEPAIELIKQANFLYEHKITFVSKKGGNINISRLPGVGEIDIAFIDSNNKVIYICECKHNRSRFDYFNWKRDYYNFRKSYENQLLGKVEWVKQNKIDFIKHLFKLNNVKLDTTAFNYDIKGVFIINAPTLYMYDSIYPTLTLFHLEQLLNGAYKELTLEIRKSSGESAIVKQPLLQNIRLFLDKKE